MLAAFDFLDMDMKLDCKASYMCGGVMHGCMGGLADKPLGLLLYDRLYDVRSCFEVSRKG